MMVGLLSLGGFPRGRIPPEPAATAQEADATDDVRKMIERGQYYKLSGPAGPRHFVVGADVSLGGAVRRGDALAITLKVQESNRGIQLVNLGGLVELQFTPDGAGARAIPVTQDNQTVDFDSPGILVVKIRDVKVLGGAWSPDPGKS
jgi:hypothetical protein